MLRPLYDTGILWALAGLSNNVTFGRIGSTYYINASLFVWSLACFAWLGLAWLALAGTAWQEVGASRKFSLHRSGRTYFFQVSSYLIGTLACFAWHGLAWLALAADTAGGRVVHHRSLFEQSEIFKFAFFCVLQQHNLGFSVLGTYHLAKWGQNRFEVPFGYDLKKFTVFTIKKMR